jgi:hypothetical protein
MGLACLTCWLAGAVSIAGVVAAEPSPAERPAAAADHSLENQPLYSQVQWSNDEYIRRNITQYLDSLNQINTQLEQTKQTAPELSGYLDAGEESEAGLVAQVAGLLRFQDQHNRRFDEWAGGDLDAVTFFEVLKMQDRQVGELRATYGDWPLHPLLWVIPGRKAKLEDHAIPKDGLRLAYDAWPDTAAPEAKKFAFFYFLRKACGEDSGDILDFLDDQTGFKESWRVQVDGGDHGPRRVKLPRWKQEDYYTQVYIPPGHRPLQPERPLVSQISGLCLWTQASGDFGIFYQAKLDLFSDLIREMGRAPSRARDAGPYLDFYSCLAGWFPCVSAFELGVDGAGNLTFIDGFRGDRPARAASRFRDGVPPAAGDEACFVRHSPVGMAFGLFQHLADEREAGERQKCFERLLQPILLLQFSLDKKDLSDEKLKEWPYRDVGVGYEGYWDFYQAVLAQITPAGKASPTAKEGKP